VTTYEELCLFLDCQYKSTVDSDTRKTKIKEEQKGVPASARRELDAQDCVFKDYHQIYTSYKITFDEDKYLL
jgi:hypothetical protein